MEELRDAIALLFKRKGRDELSEREFVLSASMDLRWFPPRDAQRLLQIGLETKLLESRDGTIRPYARLPSSANHSNRSADTIHSPRACTSGSSGTEKGNFATTRISSDSPGKSTPSHKL